MSNCMLYWVSTTVQTIGFLAEVTLHIRDIHPVQTCLQPHKAPFVSLQDLI